MQTVKISLNAMLEKLAPVLAGKSSIQMGDTTYLVAHDANATDANAPIDVRRMPGESVEVWQKRMVALMYSSAPAAAGLAAPGPDAQDIVIDQFIASRGYEVESA